MRIQAQLGQKIFWKTAAAVIGLVSLVWLGWWTAPKIQPFGTIKILDSNGTLLYESAQAVGSKQPISYEQLPESYKLAVVAAEDETFWHNPGIDLVAMARSLWLNLTRQRIVSGASTITQQLARTSVIAPNQPVSRSLVRKLREILIALRLTLSHSKPEILQMYSNTVYFGRRTYGIQAAAQEYLAKDAATLSLAESSLLVGMLASPEARNPFVYPEAARAAQVHVLELLRDRQQITLDEYDAALAEPLALSQASALTSSTGVAAHAAQAVLQELAERGIPSQQGINVYTTLDFPTQRLAHDTAARWVTTLAAKHDLSNAAVVVIENQTGHILAMVGGVESNLATQSAQVNMATALRQPGSALKPITYAAAFMQGMTPATMLQDERQVFPTKTGEGFAPNNYDGRYHGPVTVRTALGSSLNIPAVAVLHQVGIGNFLDLAQAMGITSFTQTDRYDLALTLGGGEVRLTELTNVYATFARGGRFLPASLITRIEDDLGQEIYQSPVAQPRQVLGSAGESVAYMITDILADPLARMPGFGERSPLTLSVPAAVKTGTTTDWHDNWTVGYTPAYTVGVWVGNNNNHPMDHITGVVGAAPIWHDFLESFLKDKPTRQFVRPPGMTDATGTLRQPESAATDSAVPLSAPLVITYPVQQAVFQSAPEVVANQALVFQAQVSASVKSVSWYLDGKLVKTEAKHPFSHSWQLVPGAHTLTARAQLSSGETVDAQQVQFRVVTQTE